MEKTSNSMKKRFVMFQITAWDDKCERCQLCREMGQGDAWDRTRSAECLAAEKRAFVIRKNAHSYKQRAQVHLEAFWGREHAINLRGQKVRQLDNEITGHLRELQRQAIMIDELRAEVEKRDTRIRELVFELEKHA